MTDSGLTVIRTATPEDVPSIVTILESAFSQDPVINWIVTQDERRDERIRSFLTVIARDICVPQGLTYLTEDRGAAAMWEPPIGEWPVEPRIDDAVWEQIVGTETLSRFRALADAMDAHRPEERHIYLSMIGSLPDRRGEGLGAALLDSGLIRWDREGVPTNLVSTNGDNLGFYESRGYRITAEIDLPGGGPRLWEMWRDVESGGR